MFEVEGYADLSSLSYHGVVKVQVVQNGLQRNVMPTQEVLSN